MSLDTTSHDIYRGTSGIELPKELSEEIILELLSTGKTKKKVVGFTSKAGNVFDTCLKYEDDTIKFDFENPGEEE